MDEWTERMDRVKEAAGLAYDKDLARRLGVSPQAVNEYRKKGTGLGALPKLKLLELDGERDLGRALDTVEPGRRG